ncbi:hypothetical protein JG688_00001613 [Phytophthora aleatoria]|uniref:Uncharacterized protein n=1 Tax=Phytophthora aleatoria TaxID=2496075 RepID=A0A8J5IVR5_9STRA|nr:hypothetical protein JG688_00001613 [Phytophthora aleatoria]
MAADSGVDKAVADVHYYLVIALNLLGGHLLQSTPKLEELWSAIQAEKTIAIKVFSALRTVVFSQIKPRGHYTTSEPLQRYFRAVMWVGIVDFRIAGGKCDQDLPELLCAVVLVQCLQASDSLSDVEQVDSLISSLVADGDLGGDSLSAHELAKLVTPMNIATSILNKLGPERGKLLLDLQQQIAQKGLGTASYRASFSGRCNVGTYDTNG